MPQHVVIVGAGIMGCAIGFGLARAGLRVTLLDKAVPGAEASSAAAGILGAQCEVTQPGPFLDLCLHARALWPAFAADLEAASGVQVGLLQRGVLETFADPAGHAAATARARWMTDAGLRAEVLDAQAARGLEPHLAPEYQGGLWLPDDGAVDAQALVRAVAGAALYAGATLRTGLTFDGLTTLGEQVTGVRCGAEQIPADAVVLATGAWTSLVTARVPLRSPIRPAHGQLLLLEPRLPCLQRVLMAHGSHGGYLVPRPDGRIIAGATTDAFGFHKQVTAGGLLHVLAVATSLLPVLREATVAASWSGLRPQSDDGLPILGPHPTLHGLHLAAGHYRNGILLAPVTARIVVDTLLGRTPLLDLSPFSP